MSNGMDVVAFAPGVGPARNCSVPDPLWKPVRSSVMTEVSETSSPPAGVIPAANDGEPADSCGPAVSALPPFTATEGQAALLRSVLCAPRSATWMLLIVHVPPSWTPNVAGEATLLS